MHGDHGAPPRRPQRHAPLRPLGNSKLALDGVIQGVAKDGDEIRRVHEGELFPLHHHGKVDAVLFALVLLFGEDDVERGIAAADGALVFFDGGGDLGKRLLPVAAARAHLGEVVL